MEDVHEVATRVGDIFRHAYRQNCQIDDCELSEEDEIALSELSPSQTITCLKELLDRLLTEKQEYNSEEKHELKLRCEQFEKMLQKLEGEVRSHIRLEQQLKLQIELTQEKLEAAQRLIEVQDVAVLRESTLQLSDEEKVSPILVETLTREEPTRETHHRRFPSAEIAPLLERTKQLSQRQKSIKVLEDMKREEIRSLHTRTGKDALWRKINDRPTSRQKQCREERGLTERVGSQRNLTDRKAHFSPYKLPTASRSSSKVRALDPTAKLHSRHSSDGLKKARLAV